MTTVEQLIIKIFDDQEVNYLTIKKLKRKSKIKKILRLTDKMSNTDIKNKLLPHINNAIRVVKGYKTGLYVTRNISDAEIIINAIKKKPCSLNQLKVYFPIQANKLVQLVSQMVMSGQLCVNFTVKGIINLSITNNNTEKNESILPEIKTRSDREKMKEAYDHVGGGHSFVRIHAMREYLNWSTDRFNQTLEQLTRELVIQLHCGDPSALTEQQLEDSYLDDEKQVCITITWRSE